MAEVRINDVYNPLTFDGLLVERIVNLNRFIASGVATADPIIDGMLTQGGFLGELTNYNPLVLGEPIYGTDNPADVITPDGTTSAVQHFRRSQENKAWAWMDLARNVALNGQDPAQAIISQIAKWWTTSDQARIVSTLIGIIADNEANDAGDMVIDVSTQGAITDENRISGESVIDTMHTAGDHFDTMRVIAMHSKMYAKLQKEQLIDYIPTGVANINVPMYMNLMVVIDDHLAIDTSGTNPVYTCFVYGDALIGYADGARFLQVSEIERNALLGNGSGQDILVTRQSKVWHPRGFDFTSSVLTGGGANFLMATRADLEDPSNWNRIWQRKNIPFAALKVNA